MKKRKMRPWLSKKERRAERGPSGLSVRSLMRAAASGWEAKAARPSEMRGHVVRVIEERRKERARTEREGLVW